MAAGGFCELSGRNAGRGGRPAGPRPPLLRRAAAWYADALAGRLRPGPGPQRVRTLLAAQQVGARLATAAPADRLYAFDLPAQAVPLLTTVVVDRDRVGGS